MNSIALISGLVGAMIGSLTSITTLIVQNIFQNRRESQRLIFETAHKSYELRILHLPENRAAFPIILAYHQNMLQRIESGTLTPSAATKILQAQKEMATAVRQFVEEKPQPPSAR